MPAEGLTSGTMRGKRGDGERRFSALTLATFAVALIYGAVFFWLLLQDDTFDTGPSVVVSLAPEPAAPAEQLLRTDPDVKPGIKRDIKPSDDVAGKPAATPSAPSAKPSKSEEPVKSAPAPETRTAGPDAPAVPSRTADASPAPASKSPAEAKPAETPAASGTAPNGAIRLAPAPDVALVTLSKHGPLPVISPDGRRASEVYARPLSADVQALTRRPRVALVIGGMGISATATRNAIDRLPPEVTLSFAPYGKDLQKWIDRARAAGHEVLLELPMEPYDYPENDPGPYTLLADAAPPENIDRLEWLLSRFVGYAGVMNYQGARLVASQDALRPVLEALSSRGLMYVDNGAWPHTKVPDVAAEVGLPVVRGNGLIDRLQNPAGIQKALTRLEDTAGTAGIAVGVGTGFPVTVEQVAAWADQLRGRGFVLVPVTAAAPTRPS